MTSGSCVSVTEITNMPKKKIKSTVRIPYRFFENRSWFKLSRQEQDIYLIYAYHANSKTRQAFPSNYTIKKHIGYDISGSEIRIAREELVNKGYIRLVPSSGRKIIVEVID